LFGLTFSPRTSRPSSAGFRGGSVWEAVINRTPVDAASTSWHGSGRTEALLSVATACQRESSLIGWPGFYYETQLDRLHTAPSPKYFHGRRGHSVIRSHIKFGLLEKRWNERLTPMSCQKRTRFGPGLDRGLRHSITHPSAGGVHSFARKGLAKRRLDESWLRYPQHRGK
jgi:hypothetical protein